MLLLDVAVGGACHVSTPVCSQALHLAKWWSGFRYGTTGMMDVFCGSGEQGRVL